MAWQPPDIARLNNRLAAQNRRVEGYLDCVLNRLDMLIDAALAGDWDAVRKWSLEISQRIDGREEADILKSAQQVLEAATRLKDDNELKRRVMMLIAACGKAQRRTRMP